jgi:hypothetical protein
MDNIVGPAMVVMSDVAVMSESYGVRVERA